MTNFLTLLLFQLLYFQLKHTVTFTILYHMWYYENVINLVSSIKGAVLFYNNSHDIHIYYFQRLKTIKVAASHNYD